MLRRWQALPFRVKLAALTAGFCLVGTYVAGWAVWDYRHGGSKAILLAVVALVLFVVAAATPVVGPGVLLRMAGGGTRYCLHCGSRRDPGVAFCGMCGWRTSTEERADREHTERIRQI